MARVKGSEPKPLPAERAARANLPSDGPHKRRKAPDSQSSSSDQPAFVVAVTKKESTEPKENTYKPSPETLRMKANALLNSDKLSAREKDVLSDILNKEFEA